MNRFVPVMLLGLAVALSGCGKKKPAETVVAPQTNAESQAMPTASPPGAPPAVQPASPLVQANGQVDIPEMQRHLLRWIMANRRRPASFEDFAATAGVPIPPPPAGKKYVITKDMRIALVNR